MKLQRNISKYYVYLYFIEVAADKVIAIKCHNIITMHTLQCKYYMVIGRKSRRTKNLHKNTTNTEPKFLFMLQ